MRHSSLGRRVADAQAHEEAVELGLGQRVGALVLDRVLRGEDQEGRLELVGAVVGGDLALLHRLQQRGLRLGRGAVDLVAEEQVAEHGPGPELEARGALVEDRRARHVGGQQVGRELHAAEAQPRRGGERARDQRLGHAGHVLEQDVAVGQQREQHELEHLALADHGALDLVEDRLGRRGDVAGMGVGHRSSASRSSRTASRRLGASPRREGVVGARAIGAHELPGVRREQLLRGLGLRVELDAAAAQPVGGDLAQDRAQAQVQVAGMRRRGAHHAVQALAVAASPRRPRSGPARPRRRSGGSVSVSARTAPAATTRRRARSRAAFTPAPRARRAGSPGRRWRRGAGPRRPDAG